MDTAPLNSHFDCLALEERARHTGFEAHPFSSLADRVAVADRTAVVGKSLTGARAAFPDVADTSAGFPDMADTSAGFGGTAGANSGFRLQWLAQLTQTMVLWE